MAGLSGSQDNNSSSGDVSQDNIGRFSENEAISEVNISNELEKELDLLQEGNNKDSGFEDLLSENP
jgi:hypothetical protein